VPCCIHRHVVLGAIAGVVEDLAFGLSIYWVDGDIDGGIGIDITRTVVDRIGAVISKEYSTT
jgi:hypothetical protein